MRISLSYLKDSQHQLDRGKKMETKADTKGYNIGKSTVYGKTGPLKPTELATLTCPACKKVLKEPMQVIACGHRFCRGCIGAFTSGR